MRHRRADDEAPVLRPQTGELVDPLQVDEVAERGEAELEEQQELRAAAVERSLVGIAGGELRRLLHGRRTVELERR